MRTRAGDCSAPKTRLGQQLLLLATLAPGFPEGALPRVLASAGVCFKGILSLRARGGVHTPVPPPSDGSFRSPYPSCPHPRPHLQHSQQLYRHIYLSCKEETNIQKHYEALYSLLALTSIELANEEVVVDLIRLVLAVQVGPGAAGHRVWDEGEDLFWPSTNERAE